MITPSTPFLFCFILSLRMVPVEQRWVMQTKSNAASQDLIAGTVLTWNINHANRKFSRENSKMIKRTVCRVINGSTIVALQESDGFDYLTTCENNKYHTLALGEFTILADTTRYSRIGKAYYDTGGFMLAALLHPAVTIYPQIIVVNVNFCPGCRNVDKYKRKKILNEIRDIAIPEVTPIQSLRDSVVVILGSFNTNSPQDNEELLRFQLFNDTRTFHSLHAYAEDRASMTTVDGEVLDGMITNKGVVNTSAIWQPEGSVSPFENKEPSSVANSNIMKDSYYRRLINNWNVAVYSEGDDKSATALKDCIDEFTATGQKLCGMESWVTPQEISTHLPLYLEITLPSSKVLKIGTWDVSSVGLEGRLQDQLVTARFQQIFHLFDILVLQEVPVPNTLAKNGALNFLLSDKIGVEGLGKYARELQHGLYVSNSLNLTSSQLELLPLTPEYQFPAGFYELVLDDNGYQFLVCLFSVHVNRRVWNDTTRVLNLIQENKQYYEDCQIVLAMGNFNADKDGESDVTKWYDQGHRIKLAQHLVPCFHQGTKYTYTDATSRRRVDYIFLAQLNNFFTLGGCCVVNTGDVEGGDGIQDWSEISSRYPVKADL